MLQVTYQALFTNAIEFDYQRCGLPSIFPKGKKVELDSLVIFVQYIQEVIRSNRPGSL